MPSTSLCPVVLTISCALHLCYPSGRLERSVGSWSWLLCSWLEHSQNRARRAEQTEPWGLDQNTRCGLLWLIEEIAILCLCSGESWVASRWAVLSVALKSRKAMTILSYSL